MCAISSSTSHLWRPPEGVTGTVRVVSLGSWWVSCLGTQLGPSPAPPLWWSESTSSTLTAGRRLELSGGWTSKNVCWLMRSSTSNCLWQSVWCSQADVGQDGERGKLIYQDLHQEDSPCKLAMYKSAMNVIWHWYTSVFFTCVNRWPPPAHSLQFV